MSAVEATAPRRPAPDWRDPVRITLGGTAAYGLALALGLPEAMWSVMTALIVLRAPSGRSLHAGRDRLFGTLLGALIALATVPLRRWDVPDPVLVALVLAATSSLVLWRRSLAAAPVAAIIVVSAGMGEHSALAVALLRVAEILLGAATGYALTLLLPLRRAKRASPPPTA